MPEPQYIPYDPSEYYQPSPKPPSTPQPLAESSQLLPLPNHHDETKDAYGSLVPDSDPKHEAEGESPTSSIIFWCTVIGMATLVPPIIFLLYILELHSVTRSGLTIRTTADLQNVLTISHIMSTVVMLTVPLVMSIHAYQLAAQWLKATRYRVLAGQPTPLQLGLLLSVIQGANIIPWLQARTHLSRITKESKRHSVSHPPILSRAVLTLGALLSLSYTISAFDTWLHLSSRAITVPRTSPYTNLLSADFGRQINETRCNYFQNLPVQTTQDTAEMCGIQTDQSEDSSQNAAPQGIRTLTNNSDVAMAVFTNDNHAIIVPPSTPTLQTVTYTATTHGVQTTCESITARCAYYDPSNGWGGPGLNVNCQGYPLANVSLSDDISPMLAVVDPSTGTIPAPILQAMNYQAARTNPFPTVGFIESLVYVPESFGPDGLHINNTGFIYHRLLTYNILYCNVTVREIIYEYTPAQNSTSDPTYRVLGSSVLPIVMAKRIAGTLDFDQVAFRISDRVEGAGLSSGNYEDSFALEMSRQLMSLAASMYIPKQVLSIQSYQLVGGSQLALIPLGLTVASILIYALLTLIIGTAAFIESRGTGLVTLAHLRITNSLAVVQAAFAPAEPARSWKGSGTELFGSETENDRLAIGVMAPDGEAFGISKAQAETSDKTP